MESELISADVCAACMQVWRIEKFELKEVPEEKHGQFTSGDCYVVLYTYGDPQKHVVYMWQGAEATVDERGGCALCAVQIDEQHCNGSAPQVRSFPPPFEEAVVFYNIESSSFVPFQCTLVGRICHEVCNALPLATSQSRASVPMHGLMYDNA